MRITGASHLSAPEVVCDATKPCDVALPDVQSSAQAYIAKPLISLIVKVQHLIGCASFRPTDDERVA